MIMHNQIELFLTYLVLAGIEVWPITHTLILNSTLISETIMSTIKLYRHSLSGHCHRVEFLLSILGLDTEFIDVDLMQGAQKQAEFLKKNAFGQVTVLEDGNVTLLMLRVLKRSMPVKSEGLMVAKK